MYTPSSSSSLHQPMFQAPLLSPLFLCFRLFAQVLFSRLFLQHRVELSWGDQEALIVFVLPKETIPASTSILLTQAANSSYSSILFLSLLLSSSVSSRSIRTIPCLIAILCDGDLLLSKCQRFFPVLFSTRLISRASTGTCGLPRSATGARMRLFLSRRSGCCLATPMCWRFSAEIPSRRFRRVMCARSCGSTGSPRWMKSGAPGIGGEGRPGPLRAGAYHDRGRQLCRRGVAAGAAAARLTKTGNKGTREQGSE